MCGITGIVLADPRGQVDRQCLQTMTDMVAHRGPDGEGIFTDPGVGLGHRRLSVIDLDGGAQPFAYGGGRYHIVFNGEIYNYRDLRQTLAAHGYVFTSNSDTEVIMAAYMHWGQDMLPHLNGMFAIALWDRVDASLFLARDPFGQKPLYYYRSRRGDLYFASEIAPLRDLPEVTPKADTAALDQFMAYGYVPEPRSIYADIQKLPAGHCLWVKDGHIGTVERYADLDFRRDSSARLGWGDIASAVGRHLVSDVPVGCFLSSGLDSATIASAVSAPSVQRPPPHGRFQSFTLGSDDPETDERTTAAHIAEALGLDHHSTEIRPQLSGFVDRLIDIYGEPFADPAGILTDHIAAYARGHVTVALGGDGADELLGGYRRYHLHMREERVRRALPLSVRRALLAPLARLYPKLDWAPRFLRAKSTLESVAMTTGFAYFNSVARVPDRDRLPAYSPQFRTALSGRHAADILTERLATCPSDDPLDQLRWMDVPTYLAGDILVKTDRATMAHGLEGRLPFLDRDLARLACQLSSLDLVAGSVGKVPLRRAVAGHIPPAAGTGPKRGFSMPLGAWIAGSDAYAPAAAALWPAIADSGVFDMDVLQRRLAAHRTGRHNATELVWAVSILNRMLERGLLTL